MPEPPVEYQTPVYQWEPKELTQQWHPQSAPELKKEKEPTTPLVFVKQEHAEMATDVKPSCNDYVWEEMEHPCRALEEIAALCRDREEGDVLVLDDIGEE
ncbi:hypothetical protein D1007_39441 [Hordeum vulgare]|nr:hypothetical protein D1007_39441 [Hordeum vulgare]